jgi:predicted nucleic acid-binding protein
MTVGKLRDWINEPKPMGMPKEAENLVILLFAAQSNRTFYRHGGPYTPTLQTVPDDCELRSVDLPAAAVWEPAVQRAGSIFGVAGSRLVTAGNVGTLCAEVKSVAGKARPACAAYCQRLKHRMTGIGIAAEKTARMKTAVATRALVDSLDTAEPSAVVSILAAADIATSEAAMGECRTKAVELDGNLETAGWDIFEAIGKLTDDRQQAAQEILAELREALSSDEHVVGLAPALTSAQARAVRLLTKPVEPPKPPVVTPPITSPEKPPALTPVAQGKKIVGQGTRQDLGLADAKKCLAELDEQVKRGQKARISVSWVIEE